MKNLVIRLRRRRFSSRSGYDVVVMHKYKRPSADVLERLGVIYCGYPGNCIYVNIERLSAWMFKGAVLSDKLGKQFLRLFPMDLSNRI